MKLALAIAVAFLAVCSYYFYVTPANITPDPYSFPEEQPSNFREQEAPVYYLQNVQIFKTNSTFAPESYAVDKKGNLYTSMRDGTIQRLFDFDPSSGTYKHEILARTGRVNTSRGYDLPLDQCRTDGNQHICGAPLGIRMSTVDPKVLLICDAYHGLLQLDLETRQLTQLVNEYNGQPIKFANSVLQAKDGMIYFTDSSSKFHLRDYVAAVLENEANGRLFSYNPRSKQLTLLLSNISFANGIALNHEETELYIAETARSRIHRYNLVTKVSDLFIDHLPCAPDNLKNAVHDKYKIWVGCSSLISKMLKFIMARIWLRKAITKLPLYKELFGLLRPRVASVFSIDVRQRRVSEILVDPKNRFHSVAEGFEHPTELGKLYIGTYHNNAIARFDLPDRLKSKSTQN